MDYTTNFGMKLPRRGVDMAKVDDLNDNTETIDTIMHQNRTMLGEAYDPDKVGGYTEGDFVVQLGQYYECLDDTSGTWDPTKWQLTDIGTVLKALANSGGGGGGGESYSTTETVVGTWIDGRPVYQKVYTSTHSGNTSWGVEHGLYGIADQIVDISWIAKAGSTYYKSGDIRSSGNAIGISVVMLQEMGSIGLYADSFSSGWNITFYIYLRYTKSSDL